jgi:hypothetical protein
VLTLLLVLPQVDIFKKDLVLVPINQGNAHWTCAVINFRFKRIEAYDSMGRPGGARFVFQALRSYLQLESQDKKKVNFDFDGWEDYSDHEITVCPALLLACSRFGRPADVAATALRSISLSS